MPLEPIWVSSTPDLEMIKCLMKSIAGKPVLWSNLHLPISDGFQGLFPQQFPHSAEIQNIGVLLSENILS